MFEKATHLYKGAKAHEKAKNAFERAAEAQQHCNMPYTAAKHLEAAGGMAKELKQPGEAAGLYQRASLCYRENGNPEKAADTLVKAAKVIETSDADKAIQLIEEAVDIYESEDKEHFAGSTFKYAITLMLQNNRYEQTIEAFKKHSRMYEKLGHTHEIHKAYLSIVIIHLRLDDYVAADKAYQEFLSQHGFASTKESAAAATLLDAFERHSPEDLEHAITNQLFSFLDNGVARLAKGLSFSESASGRVEGAEPGHSTADGAGSDEESII